MKKVLITILFCLLFLPKIVNAESTTYPNQEGHYSFILPDGWIEIPKSIVESVVQATQEMMNLEESYSDMIVFQLEDAEDYFQYPYFSIQQRGENTDYYKQMFQTFSADSDLVDEMTEEYSDLITDTNMQDAVVDKDRNIVSVILEGEVVGIGKIKSLIVAFMGKDNLIQMDFASKASDYSKNLSAFNQIIDSFKYDSGYEHEKEVNNFTYKIKTNSKNSKVANMIAIAIICAFFYLANFFVEFVKTQKKKKK
jgi:hypothetical protein